MKRPLAIALLALVASAPLPAAPVVALPYYTPQHFAQGLQQWQAARAAEFAQTSRQLAPALQARCDGGPLEAARTAWSASVADWERLATLALGPLLERRSARQIDFTPPRPELIARAIATDAGEAATLERVGSPAKGFPALEWLLWSEPVAAATPACRYALALGRDIEREALALADTTRAAPEPDEAAGGALLADALNQWIAGLEALRGRHLERPLRADTSSNRDPAVFPRAASGGSARSWAAQWQALRALAVQGEAPVARPGEGLVPFETFLRGLGLNAKADALRAAVRRVDVALAGLEPAQRERVLAAAAALGALKRLVEDEVAPALNVSIGFSDADGD